MKFIPVGVDGDDGSLYVPVTTRSSKSRHRPYSNKYEDDMETESDTEFVAPESEDEDEE